MVSTTPGFTRVLGHFRHSVRNFEAAAFIPSPYVYGLSKILIASVRDLHEGSIPFTRFKLFSIRAIRGQNGSLIAHSEQFFRTNSRSSLVVRWRDRVNLRFLARMNRILVDSGF
jgi:hypothetical protein